MAGRGTRLRPHTLYTPKPLIPVAGKPIVQRLVEDIAAMCDEPISKIGFVVGDFGKEVEDQLINIAAQIGAEGQIYYQEEALGTGHAIYCAEPLLDGPVIVAFADTLFRADFKVSTNDEGVIWVKQIEDPSQFGEVTVDDNNTISGFVEKPKEFVSDLAIIGIYFFGNGGHLGKELKLLMDNNVVKGGEFQLTDALESMRQQGVGFKPGKVEHWMDCGNKNATVETNRVLLDFEDEGGLISSEATIENSSIIPPVLIADGATISNSVIGPHVSVGHNSVIEDSRISNSIIREECSIRNSVLTNSMVGVKASINASARDLSLGDFSVENS